MPRRTLTYILVLALLSCSGCSTADSPVLNQLTKPLAVSTTPPPGPYNYQKGWKDGCETGIASTNSSFQMSLGTHRFTLDEQLRNDTLYNRAWKYAFNHCGFSMRSLARYHF